MKQKHNELIVKLILVLFIVISGYCVNVFAQYYYFSSGGNTYQQGCEEVLEIRVNSQGQKVRAGRFHLLLDPLTTIYMHTDSVADLRNFFQASSNTFMSWTSEGSPSWKSGSNYTILQADRNNGTQDYSGTNGLYANVRFVPEYSGSLYDITFGMEYSSGDSTTETTLSKEGGKEIIDPVQQNIYRTGTFSVLQEPCIADDNKPTITNISIADGSTKKSYLSGLTFSLKDEGGVGGADNVPYIWLNGDWTGNVGGLISNQYGIDPGKFTLELSGNGVYKKIWNTSDGVSFDWGNTRTWQGNNGLNADVTISSAGLFDFGIEKAIEARFTFYDRALNNDTKTITFNSPRGPELISRSASPANGDIYVNLVAPIRLGIKDDWAGVNSGTIKVSVVGINGTDYGMHTFSGSDLNLVAVQGVANTPDYYINIVNHEEFPTSGTIKIIVEARDMEGNVDIIDDYGFSTRPNCIDFQCCDPVLLELGGENTGYYYNTGLLISGGNNPTFTIDAVNSTGIIDCNTEDEGLSIYTGQDSFVFFTDDSVLTILGTGVKGILSGDVLTLSLLVDSAEVIIDKPIDGSGVSSGNVEFLWHIVGVENEDEWLSGYILQIYSGNELITGGFVSETGIIENLSDGDYTVEIYPIDVLGHTGNVSVSSFVVDTAGPMFDFENRSGYECETGYLEVTGVNDLLSSIPGLPYSFDGSTWIGNNKITINSQNITGFILKTGYVKDSLENISEKLAVYEFIDTGIYVNTSNLDLGLLAGAYNTGIVNLYDNFGAREGNCGVINLGLEISSCENAIGNISEGNLIVNPELYYEGTGLCNLIISDDDGNIKNLSISFDIDTKASSCALLIPQTQQCTSGEIILSLVADDVSGYNWDGSNNWMPRDTGITTGVSELGIYTGYVVDGNGNVSGCSVEITTDNLDKNGFTVLSLEATGYECQIITGYAQVSTGDTCGKKNLSDFTYNWNELGYSDNLSYGIYSGESGVQNIPVYVQDLVGNTENVIVSYKWYDSEIQFTDIEINSVGNSVYEFNWKNEADVRDGDCGSGTVEFSGFISIGNHGICAVNGDIVTYTPNVGVQYEGTDSCVFEIRDDEGNLQAVTISLNGVDTKKPECSISYNDSVCTSGSISLTMSATGANEYSWIGFDSMVADNLSYSVNGNGIYTGYLRDMAGNTGICTGEVLTFDNIVPIITIPASTQLTAEECTLIQGIIQVTDDGGCGAGFTYNWAGFGNWSDTNYSGYSEVVTGKVATVYVGDSAGNIANSTINYNWTDTGVQLVNGVEQTVLNVVLTGGNSYDTTTGGLIGLFGVREGNCGSKYISVEKVSCDGLSMDIDVEGNVILTGNSNLSQMGSCILKFSDNDGNSENGTLNIKVDTVAPGIMLEGTNVACMSTNTFDVTGTFTETVSGFESGDVQVYNGSISNFVGSDSIYTWKVNMEPMMNVTVSVLAGVAADLSWNENSASVNELTGMYDNVGPNDINLVEKVTVYSDTTSFTWGQVIDSGCAGVSGYQRELYMGECSGLPIISGYTSFGTESFDVNGLEDTMTYCRRVRPIDNFGNNGSWVEDSFDVDLSAIGCEFEYDANCTNGILQVTLKPSRDYTANGAIYLSWKETGDWKNVGVLTTGVTVSGQILTGYIYQPNTAKTNLCEFVATTIDTMEPEIVSVNVESVPECTTGTATITEISDEGCGEGAYTYNWNGEGYGNNISFQQYFDKSGTKNIDLSVKDSVGNESDLTGIVFIWTNSDISANNFTGSTNVGNSAKTTNWRLGSEAVDGACGSGITNVIWSGFVSTGNKGECTRIGDNIMYTPNLNETGGDVCEIQLKDDEDSTVNVKIYWEGIDTLAPTCSIVKEPDSCVSGSVVLTLTASEVLKQVVGGNIDWLLSENIATGSVNINGNYIVEITDLAGNVGNCAGSIDYINTGVLTKPIILSPIDGVYTNNKSLNISWSPVASNGCRDTTGYEVQIVSGGNKVTGGVVNITNWTTPELDDGNYTIKVRTLDSLGGESEREEINITIDTEKPTCTIEYSEACTSGQVQLTMLPQGANYYSWLDFENMSDHYEVINVENNGIYSCYVQDFAGNTGMRTIELNNIKTGVLSYPGDLTIVGGTPIKDNTPEFVWTQPASDGCREVSGFEVQILSGGTVLISDIVNQTGWTSSVLVDGEYTIRVRTKDTLGGESQWTELSFEVDTTAPICNVEILTQECTNSGVDIKLSGDASDIVKCSWWNSAILDFGSNIKTTVFENGIYTGYVYDLAGNQGICTGMIGTGIQDQTEISYNKQNATGYECEVITGIVLGVVSDSCGKDDLNKFIYLRDGGVNGSERGILSNDVSSSDVNVVISDGAGNSTGTTVKFTWNDIGVSLISGVNQSVGVLTGNFEITVLDIIDLFGATEGLCGKNKVSVSGNVCSGASISITDGNIVISPNNDLDGENGYCVLNFGDDEGLKNTEGKLEFVVDNSAPGIVLEGTNVACMSTNTFSVTGKFTESVQGFEALDVHVENGSISNFGGNDKIYTWRVDMNPMVEIKVFVPAGVLVDLNGNDNIGSNVLTGLYDNVGPNDVIFNNWQDTIFTTETTLSWNATTDSGCAGLSGYYYKIVQGTSCNNGNFDFTTDTSVSVSDLLNNSNYTLCIVPVDNFGNTGGLTQKTFVVDLNSIGCVIEEVSMCSSTGVTLILKPGEGIEGNISLSWSGYDDLQPENQLTRTVTEPGLLVTGYIQQISGGNEIQGRCSRVVQNIDQIDPIIVSVLHATGYECETITGSIEMSDEGCGQGEYVYEWNSLEPLGNTWYSDYSSERNDVIVYVTGYDNVGNSVSTGVNFVWYNSPIVRNNFTGSVSVKNEAKTANWREKSNVIDGLCGSGTIYYLNLIKTGDKGECTVNGDEVMYTPGEEMVGSDDCIIRVEDDEGSTGDIIVYWEGIDTQKPTCSLVVWGGQSCTSGTVVLNLNSESSDVLMYSFDGETRNSWVSNITTGVINTGIYTGYVKDIVGNVGICTGIVDTGILDKDNPTMVISNWSGFECSTGVVIVTGFDYSCGIEGLYYGWEGFDNNTNINEVYSGKVGSQMLTVTVFDGVGHWLSNQAAYIWNNIPVTGQNFVVQNVGTGITVNWKIRGSVHAGDCEEVFVSAIDNQKCTTGENYQLVYVPVQGQTGTDTCILTISDDDGDDAIVATFEGIDTSGPTVQLGGGVGAACTNEETFVVTGIFSEQVQGVSLNTLTGENVEIQGFNAINGNTYRWIVKMVGGTGKVWINSGKVLDLLGNFNDKSNVLVLGNYDVWGPSAVSLVSPSEGKSFDTSLINFEWTSATDEGCAGEVSYILEICSDIACQNVIRYVPIPGTGRTEGSLPNGISYWRVISKDSYGNTGGISPIQSFVISSEDPSCTIVEQNFCTTGNVLLTLTGDRNVEIVNSGGVNWNGVGDNYTGEISINGEIIVVVKDGAGRTGQCSISVSKHDNDGPTFVFNNNSGVECVPGSLSITNVGDNGGCAGLSNAAYKFGVGNWGTVADYYIVAQQPGSIVITGYVKDDLGNISEKSAEYTVNDVAPTANNFSTGNMGRSARTLTLAQFIAYSSAGEGNCGTGSLVYSGVKVNGSKGTCSIVGNALTYIPSSNKEGSDTCVITIKDNENTTKDVTVTFDDIDTVPPICTSWIANPGGWTSGEVTIVTLTGCSEPIFGEISHDFRENTGYTFNFVDEVGNSGSLFVEYTGFDREPPIFKFDSVDGYECLTGTLIISGAVDSGVGLRESPYSFDGINWTNRTLKELYSNIATGVIVSGYVRDGLGNRGIVQAKYTFKDSEPTAEGFTVAALNGIDVDRKTLSNAKDGACGSGTLRATVSGGKVGNCTISGDILSYKPKNDYVTGTDICELNIIDDEGSVVSGIIVRFTDINKYPYVKLLEPVNGKILNSGLIHFSWTGVGDTSAISKYVFTLWDSRDDWVEELTGSNISMNLRNGSYRWNVYAVFKDGKTGGMSKTYSLYVISIPFGSNEGFTGVKLVKDKCPDGDFSDSFYDGTCDSNGGRHGSADTDMCGVNISDYSTEQKGAYLYSYVYGITTICPIQDANLDGYLIRSHFAKMISEFAVNVLGIQPEIGKKGCDQFNDIGGLNSELRDFAVTSCELGLMGLEADGVTPAKSFNPGNYVTRAQFGTVLSRLLFGDAYNVKDEGDASTDKGFRYRNHLEALKRYGVMNKIDGDWPNYLERRGRVMIMLQRADNYGIFAGKVPAKNGVTALFDE